uniref:Uncharacterized protein n=1 Tax=Zea mays TaxID=4577 RepID=B6UEL7_MAIZE|nr:hypothetical protein [Zea mays]
MPSMSLSGLRFVVEKQRDVYMCSILSLRVWD